MNFTKFSTRLLENPGGVFFGFVLICFLPLAVSGQDDKLTEVAGEDTVELVNGDLELTDADGNFERWKFSPGDRVPGYVLTVDESEKKSGERSARVDTTGIEGDPNQFGNLVQVLDATTLRGKRIRFRAAVKTADRTENGRAQLWFKVNRKSSGAQPRMGFFDNMQDRPITGDSWQYYEIVGDIDEDAEHIVLGMLVLGKCVAWMDDASLEVVDKSVPLPGQGMGGNSGSPPEPFFVWWLVLPIAALLLFALAYSGTGWINRFAFRFSIAYWVLYCFPKLIVATFSLVIPVWVFRGFSWYQSSVLDPVVRWVAANALRIEGQLVSPFQNGSGDTTFSYVQALTGFVLAIVVAGIWSLIDWRKTDHAWLKDVLRSYLRYFLAMTMLGYGLAKLGFLFNQFASPGEYRLEQTYGDSSPMGLLWTFMGASQAYTWFAGAGETLAALLLVWRRTAVLGAMVAFGVMFNVMMLNFCYDVPVKLLSFHLVVMALFICLPDFSRLANVLFWNRVAEPVTLLPPYTDKITIWIQRTAKAFLIVMVIVIPLYKHVDGEWKSLRPMRAIGDWTVDAILVDGKPADASLAQSLGVRTLSFSLAYPVSLDRSKIAASVVFRGEKAPATTGVATIHADRIELQGGELAKLITGELNWKVTGEKLELTVQVGEKKVIIQLQRSKVDSLLMNRGFRWINERPFNR